MLDHRLGESIGPDVLTSSAKAAPPVAVSLLAATGMAMQDWLLLLTIVYTVLQIAWLVYKVVRAHTSGGRFNDGEDEGDDQ